MNLIVKFGAKDAAAASHFFFTYEGDLRGLSIAANDGNVSVIFDVRLSYFRQAFNIKVA